MPIRDILFAVLVVAIWGGNFVAAKIGMHYMPPLFYTALRFVAVGILLIPFLGRPSKAELKSIALLAVTLGTLHFSLLFGGLRMGLSIPAAIIAIQIGVPFSCLLGTYFFGDRIGVWRSLGLALSFSGLVLVAGAPDVTENLPAFLVTIAGAFSWAISNVIMKKMGDLHVFRVFGWMALFSVPLLFLLSVLIESPSLTMVREARLEAWVALAYTVLLSTLLAYGLWYPLVRKHSITQLAPFNLLSPVIGIGAGQWFFAEPLTWQMIVGGMITLAGVSIIVLRRPKTIALSKET